MSQTVGDPTRRQSYIYGGVLLGVVLLLFPVQAELTRRRQQAHLVSSNVLVDMPLPEFAFTALLGGFRALAVDLIWLSAWEAEEQKDYYRLLSLYEMMTYLQPNSIQVWRFNVWMMAFNLPRMAPSAEEGWKWVKRAIRLCEKGVERNQYSPRGSELPGLLGYIYYHRCGTIQDPRTRLFQKWLLEETGKTNWEHAVEWGRKAYDRVKWIEKAYPYYEWPRNHIYDLVAIPMSYQELAIRADWQARTADSAQAAARFERARVEYVRQAVRWFQELMPRDEFYREQIGKRRLKFLRLKEEAHAHEQAMQAALQKNDWAEALRRADAARRTWLLVFISDYYLKGDVDQALEEIFWERRGSGSCVDREAALHLRRLARSYEDWIRRGAIPEAEADRYHRRVATLWMMLLKQPAVRDRDIESLRGAVGGALDYRKRLAERVAQEGPVAPAADRELAARFLLVTLQEDPQNQPLRQALAAVTGEIEDVLQTGALAKVPSRLRRHRMLASECWLRLSRFGPIDRRGIGRLLAHFLALDRELRQMIRDSLEARRRLLGIPEDDPEAEPRREQLRAALRTWEQIPTVFYRLESIGRALLGQELDRKPILRSFRELARVFSQITKAAGESEDRATVELFRPLAERAWGLILEQDPTDKEARQMRRLLFSKGATGQD